MRASDSLSLPLSFHSDSLSPFLLLHNPHLLFFLHVSSSPTHLHSFSRLSTLPFSPHTHKHSPSLPYTQTLWASPILHLAQFTFYTDACVVASLQMGQSVNFPPPPRVGKLGNDLAPQGVVRRKEEACSEANVPWCYFAVSENNSATYLAHTLCFSHIPSNTFLVNYLGKNS